VVFDLSTNFVDNFVDNRRMMAGRASVHAGLYKLTKRKAQIRAFKIKGLQKREHETKIARAEPVVAAHNSNFVNK
jgi:hypothetical protein